MARRRRAGAKIAARNQRRGVDAMIDDLMDGPVFKVLTVDRLRWINPYTGELVSAPFDYRDAAREALRREQPWEHSRPMTLRQVQALRWSHHLRANVRDEPRLRFFHPGGEWLNPFTGAWVGGVHRIEGKIGATTIEEMALVLAECEAASGEMLGADELRRIYDDSLQAEREAGQLLARSQISGGAATSAPPAPQGIPPGYKAQPTPLGTGALEPFGWHELFGTDSPFDQTPVRNRATASTVDAHALLAKAGIDWALHPGFQAEEHGYLAGIFPTCDEQVLILIGRVLRGNADQVARLKTELRVICDQVKGFVKLVEAIATYAHQALGDGHQLQCILGLCSPGDRSLDWLACGCDPAIVATGHQLSDVVPVGGKAPLLGSLYWDDFRVQMEPSLIELEQGTAFAAHQDIYRVASPEGHQIGHHALWQVVAQLSGERPRELLTRVMGRLYRHSGRMVKDALPQVGMMAMRLRDRTGVQQVIPPA